MAQSNCKFILSLKFHKSYIEGIAYPNGVFATNQLLIIYVPIPSLEAYQAQWTTEKIGTTNVEWKTL